MTTLESAPAARRCGGWPPLCPRCDQPLVPDPGGPWCRGCRIVNAALSANAVCEREPTALAVRGPDRGTPLCAGHARELANLLGPDAAAPALPIHPELKDLKTMAPAPLPVQHQRPPFRPCPVCGAPAGQRCWPIYRR